MLTRLEKKTINARLKEIVEYLIISFFFSFFFLFIILALFKTPIDNTINLLNMMSVKETESTKEIKYNETIHKLSTYPTYGSKYAKLIIPSIKLNYPIYHGDTSDLLMKGIGHYAGSFFPGEGGSIILAGHNNVHFQHLYDVKVGNVITIDATYGTFKYKVYETKIIKADESDELPIQSKEEILMIYTCYPFNNIGYATHRYVVYANLVK